ncbi:MAG: hypothetical protein Rubg2KO_26840 [Rubricoccaceae bacterium]
MTLLRRLRPARLSSRIALAFALALATATLVGWYAVTVMYLTTERQASDDRIETWAAALPLSQWTEGGEITSSVLQDLAGEHIYLRLIEDGQAHTATPNFSGAPPLDLDWTGQPDGDGIRRFSRTWGDVSLRSWVLPLNREASSPSRWVELSTFEFASYAGAAQYAFWQLGLGIGLAILMGLLGIGVARLALRPLAEFAQTAASVDETSLHVRLTSSKEERGTLSALTTSFNAMLDRLGASIERERRFSADAAHELQTPLARLRAEVELARDGMESSTPPHEALGRVLADADGMAATVKRLLTMARLDGDADLSLQPISLSQLVAQHLERMQGEAERLGITLKADIEPGVVLEGDTRHLTEAIDNLVGNGLRYTPADGRVDVRLRSVDTDAVLEVSDTGAGFTATETPRLFERFYRSDTPAIQAHAGSGLGLAIVKRTVERHGGIMEARSDGPNQGSQFIVRLPLGVDREAPASP